MIDFSSIEPALLPWHIFYLVVVNNFYMLLNFIWQYFMTDFYVCIYEGYQSETFINVGPVLAWLYCDAGFVR